MGWRAKRWGPKFTRAHKRLHFGLEREGIRHFLNFYINGKTLPWNVDVYIHPLIVVEVDGDSHTGKQLDKDKLKTLDLEEAEPPFTVKRFWDHEIFEDLPRCLATIKNMLKNNL